MATSSTTACVAGPTAPRLPSLLSSRTIPLNSHHYLNGAFWIGKETNKKQKLASRFLSSKTCPLRLLSASAASPFDLSPPPIDYDLLETVSAGGVKVSESGVIETFDKDDEALDAFDMVIAFLVSNGLGFGPFTFWTNKRYFLLGP